MLFTWNVLWHMTYVCAQEYGVTHHLCVCRSMCVCVYIYMLTVASCTTSTNDFTLFLCFMSTHKLYRFFFIIHTLQSLPLCTYRLVFVPSVCMCVSLLVPLFCFIFTRTRDIIWIAYYIHIYYPFGVQLACVHGAAQLNDLVTI